VILIAAKIAAGGEDCRRLQQVEDISLEGVFDWHIDRFNIARNSSGKGF